MMTRIANVIIKIATSEDGAVIVEYVFLLLLIAIGALVGMKYFGNSVNNKLGNNNNSVANAIQ